MERVFTLEDVTQFGNLIQDFNPIHQSWSQTDLPDALLSHPLVELEADPPESGSSLTTPVVHGMLVASLFSCIFGTLVPGAVYLNQTLDFQHPVCAHQPVIGRVDVTRVRRFKLQSQRGILVTCDTTVTTTFSGSQDDGMDHHGSGEMVDRACVLGTANVWLPKATT